MSTRDPIATPIGEMRIVRADLEDANTVIRILDEAWDWLTSKGITGQWREPYTDHPDDIENLRTRLEQGAFVRGIIRTTTVAVMQLRVSPPAAWGDVEDDAAYISELAVDRESTGYGIGREMLKWAELWAFLHERRFLRLECWSGNPRLRRYFEEAGYAVKGDYGAGPFKHVLYEKAVEAMP